MQERVKPAEEEDQNSLPLAGLSPNRLQPWLDQPHEDDWATGQVRYIQAESGRLP